MQFDNIIEILNKIVRDNTFLSVMLLAIIGNLLYDIFKKFLYFIALYSKDIVRTTGKGISKWNRNNIHNLIKNYKEDVIKVEKVKNKDTETLYELLHDIYHNFFVFIVILISYLIVVKIESPILFYSLLGASLKYLISVFASIYYNITLFENALNFEKYRIKKENKIQLLEKIIDN